MKRSLLGAVVAIALTMGLEAGTIRHDRVDASYTNLANLPQFDGVVSLDFGSFFGGALISRNWVLTAGHIPNGYSNVVFRAGTVNAVSYPIIQNLTAPGWTGNVLNGNDFRLLQIAGDPVADGVVTNANIFQLYRGNPLDQVVTNVGYGNTGNGITGEIPGTLGTKRAGNMVPRGFFIEGNTDFNNTTMTRTQQTTIMLADFINPNTNVSTVLSIINGTTTTAAPQDLEYMLAGRDSGSPALIDDGGILKIAGVASFVATQNQSPTSIYGDISGFSLLNDSNYNWIVATAAIPEPGTIALCSLLGVIGASYGYRRYRLSLSAGEREVGE